MILPSALKNWLLSAFLAASISITCPNYSAVCFIWLLHCPCDLRLRDLSILYNLTSGYSLRHASLHSIIIPNTDFVPFHTPQPFGMILSQTFHISRPYHRLDGSVHIARDEPAPLSSIHIHARLMAQNSGEETTAFFVYVKS